MVVVARRVFTFVAAATVFAAASGTASAGAGIALAVNIPPAVTAGAAGIAANLDFRNVSTPGTLTLSLGSIKLTPSCATYTGSACTNLDNGVFAIAATGTGRASTACAGVAFTFTPHAGATDGALDVVPGSAVVLDVPGAASGGDRCIVDFTFNATKVPTKDASSSTAGRQTSPGVLADGTASDGSTALVFVKTFVTVQQATPQVVTTASAGVIAGGSVSDSAVLSGGANPGGTITFRLYGPADTTCSSAAIFTKAVTVAGNGSYGSTAFVTTVAGTHRWIATYGGDANNVAVAGACNSAGESVVVTAASPTLTSAASASVKVGTAITDSATLALGTKPTGTITFTLYGPDDATCASPVFTTTKAVNGNAKYVSAAFTPTQPGTYRWIAAYGGNAANNPVTGACNDANESVVVTKAAPTLATTASATGALGTAVTDAATLATGFAPTGTLSFVLYAANDTTCSTVLFTSGPVAVNGNGVYTSTPAFTPATAATYRWRAFYSGDANNNAVSGACGAARESVVISKIVPLLTSAATAGGAIGTALGDQATLSGGLNPTGTLRFRLYGPDDATCVTAARFTSAIITVNGNGTYASTPLYTPATAGTYRWRASYSGDANNAAVTGPCDDAGETATISQTTPQLATAASAGGAIGTTLTDQATLSGGTVAKGSITFQLFGPDDATCATPVFTSNAITVNGNGNYTSAPAFATGAAGTYRWRAFYSGDVNNVAVSGTCNATGEAAVIVPMAPSLATTASPGGVIGTALTDQASLAGGFNPTGEIGFYLYGPNDATCASAPAFTSGTVAVNGNGTYASAPFAPLVAGTYRWRAAYGGDANNAPVAGACNAVGETAIISQATPVLGSQASAAVVIGGAVTDSATLAAGVNPTGAIVFRLYGPGDATCSALVFTSGAVSVNGNGVYTSAPPFTPAAVGTYRWIASYGGDVNNAGVAGVCGAAGETVVVSPATPALATTASAGGALGTSLTDQAMLSGGFNPGGSITFSLYAAADATCAGTPVFTSVVSVSGNGSYMSAAFTPTAIGTYRWRASYGGDLRNSPVSGACNDAGESAIVSKVAPTLATTASPAVKLGGQVTDNAVLSGGIAPTGTIAFNLYAAADTACAGAPVFTSVVTVTGNGSYPSAPFTPTAIGAYRWIATYTGDAGNAAAAGACGDAGEIVSVSQATPAIVTVASAGGVIGVSLTDQATLSGGTHPTGTLSFTLYGPDDATCANTPVFTSPAVTVNGNGSYASAPFVPNRAGTFRWRAAYGGDAGNAAVAGACNDANESAAIAPSAPTIVAHAVASIVLGGSITDEATLAGATDPTGTITFSLYGPGDTSCSNAAIFSATVAVAGNGAYLSPPFKPLAAGTYRWIAAYSGDANNVAFTGTCNDAGQVTAVTAAPAPALDIGTLSQWMLVLLSLLLAMLGSAGVASRSR